MRRALPLLLAACGSTGLPMPDGGDVIDAGSSAAEPEIVRAHNVVRARALPAPMPPLQPLRWSQAAADVARGWADRCVFEHHTAVIGTYGENLFASSAVGVTPTEVVEEWATEAAGFDLASNTCTKVCGHYTQLVWRETTGVGCASKVCATGSPFGSGPWLFWVCDYTPPGNVNHRRPY